MTETTVILEFNGSRNTYNQISSKNFKERISLPPRSKYHITHHRKCFLFKTAGFWADLHQS